MLQLVSLCYSSWARPFRPIDTHDEIFGVLRKTESSISVLAGNEHGLEITLTPMVLDALLSEEEIDEIET